MSFIALGLAVVGLGAGQVEDQMADDIFAINADNRWAASGFKIQYRPGRPRIMTALHVVSSAEHVSASNAKLRIDKKARNMVVANPNFKAFHNLEIREVNLDNDLVMLGSSDLDRESGGLTVAWDANLQGLADKKVKVVGYPRNLNVMERDTELRVRHLSPLAPLKFLVDGDEAIKELRKRGSPSLEAWMLSLDGPLLPGHSGAPIFDDRWRVIAMGSGGLDSGHGGQVWASPMVDKFVPAATVQGRLAALRIVESQPQLFALEPILPPTPPEAKGVLETEIINLTSSPNPSPPGEKINFSAQVRVCGMKTAATGAVRFYYVGEQPPPPGADPEQTGRFLSDAVLSSGNAQSYRATPPFRLPGRHYFMAVYIPDDRRFAPCVTAIPLEQLVRERPGPN